MNEYMKIIQWKDVMQWNRKLIFQISGTLCFRSSCKGNSHKLSKQKALYNVSILRAKKAQWLHAQCFCKRVPEPPSFFCMEIGLAILLFASNWLMVWDRTSPFTSWSPIVLRAIKCYHLLRPWQLSNWLSSARYSLRDLICSVVFVMEA